MRVTLSKGDAPIKFLDLKAKLPALWKKIGKWTMISLGSGFYEFSFSSIDDMRSVCGMGSWNLRPRVTRVFLWTPNFNPSFHRMGNAQCSVKLMGLPQEYWSPKIIFSIEWGIRTPISLGEATHCRSFGHFARVLVDINLKASLPEQILKSLWNEMDLLSL
ncbi:hypothetical protein Lal_00049598 [Lupinus albus]|nr:hypothetical protein Lal_00049598 [Lupinus albus]